MNQNKTKYTSLLSCLPYLVFFTGSFIYFAFFADYIFFYQEKSSLYIFSSDFLFDHLNQPGGLLIYMGKFLSTFFYFTLAGAFIASSILFLIVLTILKIITFLSGNTSKILPFIFGVLLFFIQTDYNFLLFNNLGLLIQLGLFYLTIRFSQLLKGWIPVIIAPLCYFVTGSFAWGYFILLTFYFALHSKEKGWIKIASLWCVNFLIFWFSKEFLFFQSSNTLLTFPFTELNAGSQTKLFLSIAAVLSFLPALLKISVRLPHKMRVNENIVALITTTFIAIFLIAIGIRQYDKKTVKYFVVEKLFYQNKFDEIIDYNTTNPPTNLLTIFLNNIALCEKDKLNDLLFHFPQSPDGNTLFLKWEMVGGILRRGGYFYYTIGMINEAHRWAFENMVMKGHTPEGLKMLIKTELINGNYMVASKYVTLLKHTIFYRKQAKKFESLLFNDFAITSDPELGEKRKNKLETDFFSITDDPYNNIERILATDSLNIKAFEYKIAFMLVKKNFQGIADALPQFEKFGFVKFPVHVEEAALALSAMNKGNLPKLGDIRISNNAELRWNQYLTVFQQYGNNPKAAEPALRRQFGNTFWYWAFYR